MSQVKQLKQLKTEALLVSQSVTSFVYEMDIEMPGASCSREATTSQWAFGQGIGQAGDLSQGRTPNLLISEGCAAEAGDSMWTEI